MDRAAVSLPECVTQALCQVLSRSRQGQFCVSVLFPIHDASVARMLSACKSRMEGVRVRSRYGEALLPIRITTTVRPGELFATLHFADIFLNRVTSPHRDRYVKSPEYKVTAVRIEKERIL